LDDQTSIYESLRAWILQLPGVKEAPHRVGGIEFQVGGVEFMHSHGPSSLDIRLSKQDQASVLKTGQVLRHQAKVHDKAGWVSFRIEVSRDLANARKVVQLAYENAKKNLQVPKAKNAVKLS
jgi:luciferase-like monooxygenase